MYITKYIIIGESGGYSKIYSPCENSILLVSNNLLVLLEKLRARYKDNPIDENDPLYIKLYTSDCFHKIKSARFITDSIGEFERKFANAFQNVDISEIYLHITQECNLRCTYCYAKNNLGKKMMMGVELAERVLDQIANVRHVVLTGGEPLLNVEIDNIINEIRKRSAARISLLTNGTLMMKCLDTLYKVDSIIVSLDVGSSQNRKGLDAKKVLEHLEQLPNEIKRKIDVRSVISPGEECLISTMKRKIHSLGMSYITVPKLPNTPEDVFTIPDIALISNENESAIDYKANRCAAGTSIIAIDWNGDIYPCQSLIRKELKIGNIMDSTWKEMLEGSQVRHAIMNANVQKIEKCKLCDYKYICGGGCRALSYNVYGSFDHRLDFFCERYLEEARSKLNTVSYIASE